MDDEAASPVVATILLLAITVLLAAAVFAAVQAFQVPEPPSFAADHGGQGPYGADDTGGENGRPGPSTVVDPPRKEERWQVEPTPGWDCQPVVNGIRDYLCSRVV